MRGGGELEILKYKSLYGVVQVVPHLQAFQGIDTRIRPVQTRVNLALSKIAVS